MRKILVSLHTTLNGIVTGPDDDPDHFEPWAKAGIPETTPPLIELFDRVDTILLGHRTFDLLGPVWSTVKDWPNVDRPTLRLGEQVNTTPKVVVARREIQDPTWGEFARPMQIVGKDTMKQIEALKAQPGRDIITFGSPSLVRALLDAGLVDEFHLNVHPVVVAQGGTLFDGIGGRTDLHLASARPFPQGTLLVHYDRAKRTS